jgi:hypothetical protein
MRLWCRGIAATSQLCVRQRLRLAADGCAY